MNLQQKLEEGNFYNFLAKKIIGGAGQCVNNKTREGLPIDPITLATIPLNKSIQLPTSYQEFPYESRSKDGTDYYCFNQDSLLQWLQNHTKNPFTGVEFNLSEGNNIHLQLKKIKGKIFEWNNGYKSVFSHGPLRRSNAEDESPWPEGLRKIILGNMYPDFD